jgi:pimeloyl-ACP methyl ester carboxylesterase
MAIDQWTGAARGVGAYADVNGINLYYETHGTGKPLILLHGGLGSGEMFGPILPALAADRYSVFASPVLVVAATAFLDRPAG